MCWLYLIEEVLLWLEEIQRLLISYFIAIRMRVLIVPFTPRTVCGNMNYLYVLLLINHFRDKSISRDRMECFNAFFCINVKSKKCTLVC